jgi:hypothetical protein
MDSSEGKTNIRAAHEPDNAWSSDLPQEETEEWIISFKPASGILVKIERLLRESGERQELTPEEYSALAALGLPIAVPSLSGSGAAGLATDTSPMPYQAYYQAYYQGIYDYANYLVKLYTQNVADGSLPQHAQDPFEAQRLRLANYAALHTSPDANTGS